MDSVPPRIADTNAVRPPSRIPIVVLGATAVVISVVVYFFNPIAYHFYPVCQFHQLTGLNCPGCGGTRSVYELLHGHLAVAFRDNALVVIGGGLMAARAAWFALNRLRGRPNGHFFPPRYIVPAVVVMVLFGIVRNLPVISSYLSPL